MMRWLYLLFVFWMIVSKSIADENPPPSKGVSLRGTVVEDTAVRDAVRNSLPFLATAGVAWMEERGCMSCHHVPFLIWTHHAASAKGFDIDPQKLADWEAWSIKDSLEQRNLYRLQSYELGKIDANTLPATVQEKLKPLIETPFKSLDDFRTELKALLTEDELRLYEPVIIKAAERAINAPDRTGGGLDVLGQLLLSTHNPASELQKPEFREGVIGLMQQVQQPDGFWVPGNQFQTMRQWSPEVANQSTTMWAAIALAEYSGSTQSQNVAVEKSIAWQRAQPSVADNYEWLATRLLWEKHFGSPQEVQPLRQQLMTSQNPDGGWGWQKGAASDPYTTGLITYVLARVCAGESVEEIQSARSFLLASQQQDGSWHTQSKNISNTTDPERLKARDEIYHYWGSAWATLGLLESLEAPPGSR